MNQKKFLEESLKPLEIIRESRETSKLNLKNLNDPSPFLTVPLAGFLKKNPEKQIIPPKNKETASYLDSIKFPMHLIS